MKKNKTFILSCDGIGLRNLAAVIFCKSDLENNGVVSFLNTSVFQFNELIS